MSSLRSNMHWEGGRLKFRRQLSGYSIVPDQKYPTMWRVRRPDGTLSDMVNRTRAKDAAMLMLGRDLNEPAEEAQP